MKKFFTLLAFITAFSNISAMNMYHPNSFESDAPLSFAPTTRFIPTPSPYRGPSLMRVAIPFGVVALLSMPAMIWVSKKIDALKQVSDDEKNTPEYELKMKRLEKIDSYLWWIGFSCGITSLGLLKAQAAGSQEALREMRIENRVKEGIEKHNSDLRNRDTNRRIANLPRLF